MKLPSPQGLPTPAAADSAALLVLLPGVDPDEAQRAESRWEGRGPSVEKLTAQSQEGRVSLCVDGVGSWLTARERSDCCLLAHTEWTLDGTQQELTEDAERMTQGGSASSNTNRKSRRQKHNSIKTKFKVLLNRGKP